MVRAKIGVDGNAGYALLGANIQDGECEFIEVPIEHATPNALRWASKQALAKLRVRLNLPELCWYAEDDYWGAHFEPHIT